MNARERGAVLVEFAIVAPVLVLLIVGGVLMGAAMYQRMVLQDTLQQAMSSLTYEDEIARAVEARGGRLVCFEVLDESGGEPCYADGFDGLRRAQAVAEGFRFEVPFFGPVIPRASVTDIITESETEGEP